MKIQIKENYFKIVEPSTSTKWLTSYKDTDDITTYSGSKIIYTPLTLDPSTLYREITDTQHKKYIEARDTAIKNNILKRLNETKEK